MGGATGEMDDRNLAETGQTLEDELSFSLSLSKKFHVLRKESGL